MQALKYQVTIGRDRRVSVDVPASVGEGPAEVIVLVPEPKQEHRPEAVEDFGQMLDRLRKVAPVRSREEILRFFEQERASWEDDTRLPR